MKLCTVIEMNDDDVSVIEVSVVPDDHAFGWHDDRLHIEGQILDVAQVAPRSGE